MAKTLCLSASGHWTPPPMINHCLSMLRILHCLGYNRLPPFILDIISYLICMTIAVPQTEQLGWSDSKFFGWNQAIWLSRSPTITCPRSKMFIFPPEVHSSPRNFPALASDWLLSYDRCIPRIYLPVTLAIQVRMCVYIITHAHIN